MRQDVRALVRHREPYRCRLARPECRRCINRQNSNGIRVIWQSIAFGNRFLCVPLRWKLEDDQTIGPRDAKEFFDVLDGDVWRNMLQHQTGVDEVERGGIDRTQIRIAIHHEPASRVAIVATRHRDHRFRDINADGRQKRFRKRSRQSADTTTEVQTRSRIKRRAELAQNAQPFLHMGVARREEIVDSPLPAELDRIGEHAKQRIGVTEGVPVTGQFAKLLKVHQV